MKFISDPNYIIIISTIIIVTLIFIKISFSIKKLKIKSLIDEIRLDLKNQKNFPDICEKYNRLPVDKIKEIEDIYMEEYINIQLNNYETLNLILTDIQEIFSHEEKGVALSKVIIRSVAQKMSAEKISQIYFDCLVMNQEGLNTKDEEGFILAVIASSSDLKTEFKSRVIDQLKNWINLTHDHNKVMSLLKKLSDFEEL